MRVEPQTCSVLLWLFESSEHKSTTMDLANLSLGSHRTDVSVFDYQYQWTIGNFKFCCGKKPGESLSSPTFVVNGTQIQGRLKLYPNGVDEDCEKFVSVYLELESRDELTAEFHVRIRKTNARRSSELVSFTETKVHGFRDFVRRDAIFDDEMLVNGELTLVCDVTVSTGVTSRRGPKTYKVVASKEGFSENFEQMLRRKKFCDVTLRIDDREFEAHRVILGVRSERFNRLFTRHSAKSYFKIKDIPVGIMDAVLTYFYTGEVYVDGVQVEDFLNVALSYQFMDQELKGKIEDEVLISQIDVDNAAELLVIAYDYNLDKLYDNILEFVFDHRAEVLKSEGYERVIEARSDFFEKNGIILEFDEFIEL